MIDAAAVVGTWRMLSWKREFVETGEQIELAWSATCWVCYLHL